MEFLIHFQWTIWRQIRKYAIQHGVGLSAVPMSVFVQAAVLSTVEFFKLEQTLIK